MIGGGVLPRLESLLKGRGLTDRVRWVGDGIRRLFEVVE
jgi:hypothetical protein